MPKAPSQGRGWDSRTALKPKQARSYHSQENDAEYALTLGNTNRPQCTRLEHSLRAQAADALLMPGALGLHTKNIYCMVIFTHDHIQLTKANIDVTAAVEDKSDVLRTRLHSCLPLASRLLLSPLSNVARAISMW